MRLPKSRIFSAYVFGRTYYKRLVSMDLDRIKVLQEQDWDDIAPRLLGFVKGLAGSRGITYIPGGLSPEDVAMVCIEKLYNGDRNWDPQGSVSLLEHLMGTARSLLSKKGFLRKERDKGVSYIDSEEMLDVLSKDPEQEPTDEATHPLVKGLYSEIDGDDELMNVVAAIEMGCEKPREIAELAGIDRKRIHEVKRRLLRKGVVVRKKLGLKPDLEEGRQ
jgi:DNA-directed RNA polymerase specialized sigma24 family protein